MKSGILYWLFFLAATGLSAQHKKVSVLFIGNSYTYVNNLPLLVDSIVTAGGDTLDWEVSALGGYTLKMHAYDTNTIAKINQQQWDYVVLQEQSQLPSLDPNIVDTATIPYALFLDSVIHANNPCTQTVFFETWGRKYGDASNCAFYPPVCTYDGMQQRLLESYKLMADTCHGIVAPVGEAYRTCIAYDSTVELYSADYSHPSLNGSFLAASVFYNIFFHKSAAGNSYNPGVTQLTSIMYHLFARQTVAASLNFWNLGIYEPWAEFSWDEAPGCNGVYYGNSNSNFSHYWDFGDSTTSTDPSPVHHYLYSHYFPVLHIVYNACSSDTFMLVNNMVCNWGSVSEDMLSTIEVFPNPANGSFTINNSQYNIKSLSIFNMTGEHVYETAFADIVNPVVMNISALPEGIYFLQFTDENGRFSFKKFAIMR